MNNQQKAYELKQTGLTYREVAKEMGLVSDESARAYARRYSGKKKAVSINTETSRFAVIDAAARALGLSAIELKTIASSGRHKVTPPSQFSGLIKGKKHKTMKSPISIEIKYPADATKKEKAKLDKAFLKALQALDDLDCTFHDIFDCQ
jgi:transcriptional regulator with XRE-family HTH domain